MSRGQGLPDRRGGAEPTSELRGLLGPTNTGKTHQTIERMLEHDSGMIGLPLRLLAREVYDRVTARVGEGAVALVTGEEKRIPSRPRYWICTVEAMPVDLPVDFLAVDEIQLATGRQRGHVFTDRMLHARGNRETWFCGSATMRPLLSRLCPTAVLESRPRLSTLSDAGSLPLSALPPRSVVVAFSATRVYQLAEQIRRKRGGAAVVIGALSPRARNAQVALFQSGEVDILVATDAIGMGLNLDVDNVVFADLRKFDGRETRPLYDTELAQIAGRAGRHIRDGRFATLAPLPPFATTTARALEQHRFAPDEQVFWRNHELDFSSIDALLTSLHRPPPAPWLRLADDAEDLRALQALAKRTEVVAVARGEGRVRLLWEVCQIPDFRQLPFDDHFNLQAAAFVQLAGPRQRLERAWVEAQLARLERTEGDLETLLDRMSAVRTWTYITAHGSHEQVGGLRRRQPWVDEAASWQRRTHALEDRLSDALHEQLVARFVDEKRGGRIAPAPTVTPRGARSLAGELFAKVPAAREAAANLNNGRRDTAEVRARREEEALVDRFIDAEHAAFFVGADARLFGRHDGGELMLGRLVRGADRLHPDVTVTLALHAGTRLRLERRLLAYARDLVAELLVPLEIPEPRARHLGADARGLLYQLRQALGSVRVEDLQSAPDAMTAADRRVLRDHGIILGRLTVFSTPLFSAAALRKRRALCTAELWPGARPPAIEGEALSISVTGAEAKALPDAVFNALGYPRFGGIAVRADETEIVGDLIAEGASVQAIASHLGCGVDEVSALVTNLREQQPRQARRRGRRRS
ncbi:MAG TPA: helicase-related protein [Polyangia bacterium]